MPKRKQGGHKGQRKAIRRQYNDMRLNEQLEKQTQFYFSAVESNQGKRQELDDNQLNNQEQRLFDKVTGTVGIDFNKYDNIPVQRSGQGEEGIPPLETFADMVDNPPWLDRNIQLCGYKMPTPVQKHAVPIACCKRDIMCCAQTGSGKTAAFLLPAIADFVASPPDPKNRAAPGVLIFAPTRELALQIFGEAEKFCHRSPLRACTVYGGKTIKSQLLELAAGCDILAATPGRLKDFVDRGVITLSKVRYLVLDEADRMLDMGFEPQIRYIVQQTDCLQPPQRQTLMFSATFPKDIQKLAADFMSSYIWISIGRVGSTTSSITQRVLSVRSNKKVETLTKLFEEIAGPTLVFTRTKRTANRLYSTLRRAGISCQTIHGDRSQFEREDALMAFRNGQAMALIATDVAGRGLDINNVTHVINYDLPPDIDSYVHRIGRTARVGKRGTATSLFVAKGKDETKIQAKLAQLLAESKQEVPEWLTTLVGEKGKVKKGESSNYGATDARSIQKRTIQQVVDQKCASCGETKLKSEFSKTQIKLPSTKRKCTQCAAPPQRQLKPKPNVPSQKQQELKQQQQQLKKQQQQLKQQQQQLKQQQQELEQKQQHYQLQQKQYQLEQKQHQLEQKQQQEQKPEQIFQQPSLQLQSKTLLCTICQLTLPVASFSKKQRKTKTLDRKCKICMTAFQPIKAPTSTSVLEAKTQPITKRVLCSKCGQMKLKSDFTGTQLRRTGGKRKCKDCIQSQLPQQSQQPKQQPITLEQKTTQFSSHIEVTVEDDYNQQNQQNQWKPQQPQQNQWEPQQPQQNQWEPQQPQQNRWEPEPPQQNQWEPQQPQQNQWEPQQPQQNQWESQQPEQKQWEPQQSEQKQWEPQQPQQKQWEPQQPQQNQWEPQQPQQNQWEPEPPQQNQWEPEPPQQEPEPPQQNQWEPLPTQQNQWQPQQQQSQLPKQSKQQQCIGCGKFLSVANFSKAQKKKPKSKRRCKLCVASTDTQTNTVATNTWVESMCAMCHYQLPNSKFSSRQLRELPGARCCLSCEQL